MKSSNNITDLDLTDPYINAKVISHDLICNAMKKYNLPILILMPSAIMGIDDYKKTPSNLLINKFMSYPLNKFYINAGLNIVNVKDVVMYQYLYSLILQFQISILLVAII